jgi:nucleoid DNA-binding protein
MGERWIIIIRRNSAGRNRMTKQEIVNIVSEATGLTKVETETVMNGIMSTIIDSLAKNNRVELRGFGTFGIKHRMPKKARNPGTGEPVYLPERYVPTFKPSKLMRSSVNELINK